MVTAHGAHHSYWNKLRTHAVLLNVTHIQCLPMLRENTTRTANKMSPKNVRQIKAGSMCHNCHLISLVAFFFFSVVSAKQATCAPSQREVRSQVRCLLILGSSTQKLFNNNSVNISLQNRYALFSSLIKTHGVKLNRNSPALFWKLVMKLVRNSSSWTTCINKPITIFMLSGMVEDTLHRCKVLSNPLRNMKQELLSFFQLGAANTSHPCLAIPLVLAGPFEGTVMPQHWGRTLQAAPAHARRWRVPDALGKTHSWGRWMYFSFIRGDGSATPRLKDAI